MAKPHSYDLRQKVIQAIQLDGLKISEVCLIFNISRNTIRLWLKRQRETGDFQALPNQPPGNGHQITNWENFVQFVEENGDKTQVEMASLWPEKISDRTISRALKKNWIDSQKKTYGYQERNEMQRPKFLKEIAKYKPADRVYIDEAGMDNREDYGYGWNEKGQRFHALKSRNKGRVNMIAAYCDGQLFAPFTVEGSCNRTVFETWLETCLIPTLKPGQVVIADNATFPKGGRIQELIEAAGCQLKYLPSYSPDLNKIEHCWSWLKSRIRKQISQFNSLRDAMENVLRTAQHPNHQGGCYSLTALAVAISQFNSLRDAMENVLRTAS